MSNIVDDLLQDVEELNHNTDSMNKNSDLEKTLQAARHQTLIQTAQITQEAAKHNHSATSQAIKLSETLKARTTELDELSTTWRQAIRNTLKEQQTTKKYFAVMLGATLAISVVSLGSTGYFFYLLNQQNAQHKGDVLDIIQTESQLLSNKLIVKTDEMAALVEAMSADVKRLSHTSGDEVNTQHTTAHQHNTKASPQLHFSEPELTETLTQHYNKLKQLIQSLNKQVQKITTSSPYPLTQSDRTLNNLITQLQKQEAHLQAIQNTLKARHTPVVIKSKENNRILNTLKTEISTLNQQYNAIQTSLKTLQNSLSDYLKQTQEISPYRYKAPETTTPFLEEKVKN